MFRVFVALFSLNISNAEIIISEDGNKYITFLCTKPNEFKKILKQWFPLLLQELQPFLKESHTKASHSFVCKRKIFMCP